MFQNNPRQAVGQETSRPQPAYAAGLRESSIKWGCISPDPKVQQAAQPKSQPNALRFQQGARATERCRGATLHHGKLVRIDYTQEDLQRLGLIVVRGPTWRYGDEDGGEGGVGTVTDIKRQQTVQVTWDNGNQYEYRIGAGGSYDLLVLNNAQSGLSHNQTCQYCPNQRICGIKWKCSECTYCNLCTQCYMNNKHSLEHTFYRGDSDNGQRCAIMPPRSSSRFVGRKGMYLGANIAKISRRGFRHKVDEGVVLTRNETSNKVQIRWANSEIDWISLNENYGTFNTKIKCPSQSFWDFYYPDHLPMCGDTLSSPMENARCYSEEKRFRIGDKVKICLPIKRLKEVTEPDDTWSNELINLIGKPGEVLRFSAKGHVLVSYDLKSLRLNLRQQVWSFNQALLEKIKVKPQQSKMSSDTCQVSKLSSDMCQVSKLSSVMCQVCHFTEAIEFEPCGHRLACEGTDERKSLDEENIHLKPKEKERKKETLDEENIHLKPKEKERKKETLDEENIHLKQKLNEVEEKNTCAICMDADKDMAFNPCGHGAFCVCASGLTICHICREKILTKLRLY